MGRFLPDRTVVTHRLHALDGCTQIVRVEKGRVTPVSVWV
jgi:ABC-type transport system involved in cytochrome bd biosynthesis fused ATPase/permease subunit